MTTINLDPITLEVLWNRLLAVVNEQQVALIRTAFSTVVRDSQDLACGVFDQRARMVAQSLTGTPGHINAMATGMKHFVRVFPPDSLREGDVLITNDPWQTAGQINDFTVVTPIFKNGKPIAYFATCCHAPDIGGRVFSAEAKEVFEEGLRVPIMKLFIAGAPNETLINIIRANVRTPDETIGDLYAQMSSNAVGGRSLLALLNEFGMDDIEALAGAIINRSERAMRQAIREVPNGVYRHEAWTDGFDEPIKISVAVTVRDEDIDIDFDGSSPQSRWGINVVLNYTHAYASFAMKAAICPDVPHNDGAFTPVHVSAPRGCILNCVDPAPVASRNIIGHFLPCVIFSALAPALPGRLIANGADPLWMTVWHGARKSGETLSESFLFTAFQCGGSGARATKDGLNATGFPSGVAGVPAEVIESLTPMVLHRRELRTDSGGPGTQRGGLGQWTAFGNRSGAAWQVSPLIDRTQYPATGAAGGGAGAAGELILSDGRRPQPKSIVPLGPDIRIHLNLPGGGGYGLAKQRPAEVVLADVVNGYVSIEAAGRDYGVVVRYLGTPNQLVRLPKDYAIDWDATRALRGEGVTK
jgi:N-methylhydantoinase B